MSYNPGQMKFGEGYMMTSIDLICSQTDSWGKNRASHGVKVAVSTGFALWALRRLAPTRRQLEIGLALSNLSFSAVWLTHGVLFSTVIPEHNPGPYNRLLNQIWDEPQTRRARCQFPTFTGLEVATLLTLMTTGSRWQRAVSSVGFLGLAIRGVTLWGVLSEPPVGGGEYRPRVTICACTRRIVRECIETIEQIFTPQPSQQPQPQPAFASG